MRNRLAVLLSLALVALAVALVPPAVASPDHFYLAQGTDQTGQDSDSDGGVVGDEDETGIGEGPDDGSDGSDDADTETGAGEGEQAAETEEVGPVWTYQMAKIVIVLLFLMALSIGLSYYRLVVRRQRAGI
jgi:hypothetical protein